MARVIGPIVAGALYDLSYGLPYYLASAAMLAVLIMARSLPTRAQAAGDPDAVAESAADPQR
jgi:hypothetical protein